MSTPDNRRIRIFISSTFRDMMEERDELMTHTWPELRRFCHERQVELVEVDLRWGIAEEQSTRKETLRLCLDEIRACRPFFIGLLGERYGWTPDADAFTADLKEEQPWLRDLPGRSVTELEILHGVLNNPDLAGRAFFYFRDPAYAKTRGADFLPENADVSRLQAALKQIIQQTCTAKQIPLRENYPDPVKLAALVLEDLKAAIEAQFPKADIPDALTREARDHEAFAETRCRTYIGRLDCFEALDRHAAGDDAPLVLLGDSGSGKSALLANWLAHWHKAHPKDFIFQHYIGGTPDSAEHSGLMTRLVAEIKRWTGDPEELPKSHDDLSKTFPAWLGKARLKAERESTHSRPGRWWWPFRGAASGAKTESDGIRFIVVLDALNQLEDRDHARLLGWLPSHPFTGALRLIVSTLPGDTLTAVTQRGWKSLRVPPLTPGERHRMIEHYLARFGKKLDAPRLERIAATPAAAHPLYLKILLDELRVTGTHERLDERLQDYLAATDIPALLKKALARYQRDYERDRPGLVSETLRLIWAARRGLTEAELLRLLRPANLPQLPWAIWTPLRAALEEGLVDRGGVLNFTHNFLRAAVEAAYVPDEDKRTELRLQLAGDFEQQPVSARSCDELPWLLWQTESFARLRTCLLGIDGFLEIRKRDQEELKRYWVWLKEERTMGRAYLASFEPWSLAPGREDSRISYAANELAIFLGTAAQHAEAERLFRRALAIAEKIVRPDHPDVAKYLNNLASLFLATNRLAEAEPLMRRVAEILEKNDPEKHHALALNNLATLFLATNRLAEAEPLLHRALGIDEHSFGPEHPIVAFHLKNLIHLLQTTNRLGEAERLMRRALGIDEKSFGPDHPSVASDLNNLGLLLQATNRPGEAERLMRRALGIDEKSFGPDHPSVARSLNNLGLLLQATNRLAEAEPLMRRALAIWETSLDADCPDVATALNNLASLLYKTNRASEAEPLMRRNLEIFLKFTVSTGHQHSQLQVAIGNYAALLSQMGRKPAEVHAQLNAVGRPYGMQLGGRP